MITRRNDKVCIIGSAPTKELAPYSDQSYDIWAISSAAYSESLGVTKVTATADSHWNDVHRVDVFFEMHKEAHHALSIESLINAQKPVMMQKVNPRIIHSEEYPVEKVAWDVGEEFTSTIAYMMAYAIHLGYKEIYLFGVLMGHQTEYAHQRGGIKYYAGVARERGIKFWAPPESQLSIPMRRYAFTDYEAICAVIQKRKADLEHDVELQKKVVKEAELKLARIEGAVIDCDDIILTLNGGIA